jgi:putative transcriptional regulator
MDGGRLAMKKYKSKIAAAVHEAMQDAHDAGVIDKRTMRQFDASCLTRAEVLSAREIQRLRKREGVSQSVFARHLKVAACYVPVWGAAKFAFCQPVQIDDEGSL